jgi:predicted nucleic acid-binding protein
MQQFLVDANVFVAAIKNPEKKAGALDLILELISDDDIHLVGNDLLFLEFERYSQKFKCKLLRAKALSVCCGLGLV